MTREVVQVARGGKPTRLAANAVGANLATPPLDQLDAESLLEFLDLRGWRRQGAAAGQAPRATRRWPNGCPPPDGTELNSGGGPSALFNRLAVSPARALGQCNFIRGSECPLMVLASKSSTTLGVPCSERRCILCSER